MGIDLKTGSKEEVRSRLLDWLDKVLNPVNKDFVRITEDAFTYRVEYSKKPKIEADDIRSIIKNTSSETPIRVSYFETDEGTVEVLHIEKPGTTRL